MKLEGALCFGVSMSFKPFVRNPRYIRVLLNIGRNRESEFSSTEELMILSHREKSVDMKESSVYNSPHFILARNIG